MKIIILLPLLIPSVTLGQIAHVSEPISQHDSTDLAIATNFLIEKLGQNFVKQNLIYKGHYQSVLHMITFEIVPQKKFGNRNMIIVSIDGGKVETKYNTKINKADITDYYRGVVPKNIFFNRNYALQQAKRVKLDKGIKEWELEIEGVAGEWFWQVKSFTAESFSPVWDAKGKQLEINIKTGKLSKNEWSEIE